MTYRFRYGMFSSDSVRDALSGSIITCIDPEGVIELIHRNESDTLGSTVEVGVLSDRKGYPNVKKVTKDGPHNADTIVVNITVEVDSSTFLGMELFDRAVLKENEAKAVKLTQLEERRAEVSEALRKLDEEITGIVEEMQ